MMGYRSPYDGYSRATLRVGLALVSAVVFLGEASTVASIVGDPHYADRSRAMLHFADRSGAILRIFPSSPALAWVLYAFIVLGLLLLALDRFALAAGAWTLGWMCVMSQWQAALFGSPSRNSFFPGAMLFGWVVGLLWARLAAGPDASRPEGRAYREELAEAGAMACIAAGYTGSALSKLFAAGLDWVNHAQIRWLILSQEPLAPWPWLLSYRQAILDSPGLARLFAAATLVVEGGGVLLLLGPRLRLGWTALIWGLHVNIILICLMPYLEPMALLLVFALPWPRIFRRPRVENPLQLRRPELRRATIPDAMWLLLSALISLSWLLPVGWRAG
jgi:hypothetical protein